MKPIALSMVSRSPRPDAWRPAHFRIGGITTWRDAAEFMALGCGTGEVCTAAMVYAAGFKIVKEMIAGLEGWMDEKGYPHVRLRRPGFGRNGLWQYLNLNYITKARIDQELCIKCGRCHIACEDTSHQAITHMVAGKRHFEVIDAECVGCNLCVEVCPVESCISMETLAAGAMDARTGRVVESFLTPTGRRTEQPDGKAGGGVVRAI